MGEETGKVGGRGTARVVGSQSLQGGGQLGEGGEEVGTFTPNWSSPSRVETES